ncbi:UDP-glucose/GDP-mannose dehydrogenase family protein [Tsukamurella strandjordii]|uniref:UDP-glucose dehydrogenase family protein n=1 Tax=Tsukamurella strandjordii TaxID=147577 RepID=UPI0031DCF9C5
MKMTVLGTGYLGATHAACMAELGHEVLGVDVNLSKIAALSEGKVPFHEPGLPAVLKRNIEAGRLRFTDSYEEAGEFGDVHFIAVGTPQRKGEFAADLTYVNSVVDSLVPHLRRDAVILGKSTVPVGTTELLRARAAELTSEGITVEFAWNPEFLREGHAVKDTLEPDRLVLGAEPGGRAEQVAREIYAPIIARDTPFFLTDTATAELVKISANAFLATKISFINAVSEVCEAAGADVVALADAIGVDSRIGRRFLGAGIGFGGGCLPKDIRAFMARSGELGAGHMHGLLREVDAINMSRRTRMVDLAREACGGSLLGAKVAVLGAAFKPDSDDVRDSPALNIAGQIQLQGAAVSVYDPEAMDNSRRVFPTLDYATTALEACEGADVVLVLTEWTQFRELDPAAVGAVVRRRSLLDGRNCMPAEQWRAAGWAYRA